MKDRNKLLLRSSEAAAVLLISSLGAVRAQAPIAFRIAPGLACVGETVRLTLTNAVDPDQLIGLPGDLPDWNFGANAPVPKTRASIGTSEYGVSYSWAGVYPFTMQLVRQGRLVQAWFGGLIIEANPAVQLELDTTACAPVTMRLAPRNALPAGSTLRWSDGPTGTSILATAPDNYWLEVTSPGRRCSSRVSRVIRAGTNCGPDNPGNGNGRLPAAGLIANIITPNRDDYNDYFVLDGLVAAERYLQVFNRWGRAVFRQEQYGTAGVPGKTYRAFITTRCAIFRAGSCAAAGSKS